MLRERHIEAVRNWVLTFNDVEETTPFGPDTLVYKTAGKMFLLLPLDEEDLRFNVKCAPNIALELREQYPQSVLPGYHMDKKHWNTVVCNPELSLTQIAAFISDSYQLIRSKNKK
jgi:predicted DNA-binding protein (MmcQ/YjbR family)